MISVCRAEQRQRERSHEGEAWLTFDDRDGVASLADRYGPLEMFREDRFAPGAARRLHQHHDVEIVTYVSDGMLAFEDSTGRSGVIHTGEFQSMTMGPGVRHSETNPSATDSAQVFEIWLRPSAAGLKRRCERKRFTTAERRGELRIIASPDARRESLRLHSDTLVYSAILNPGTHIIHAISPGRSVWLHIVGGEVTLGEVVLTTGDGAGIAAERAVSFTAREETEVLLLDLVGEQDCGP